jgi:hypothetical protein
LSFWNNDKHYRWKDSVCCMKRCSVKINKHIQSSLIAGNMSSEASRIRNTFLSEIRTMFGVITGLLMTNYLKFWRQWYCCLPFTRSWASSIHLQFYSFAARTWNVECCVKLCPDQGKSERECEHEHDLSSRRT